MVNRKCYLAVENFTVLPHYSRKIKYGFCVIEGKIYLRRLVITWLRNLITRIFILLVIYQKERKKNFTAIKILPIQLPER